MATAKHILCPTNVLCTYNFTKALFGRSGFGRFGEEGISGDLVNPLVPPNPPDPLETL